MKQIGVTWGRPSRRGRATWASLVLAVRNDRHSSSVIAVIGVFPFVSVLLTIKQPLALGDRVIGLPARTFGGAGPGRQPAARRTARAQSPSMPPTARFARRGRAARYRVEVRVRRPGSMW